MLKLTLLVTLFFTSTYAFPPDHLDKVVHDYAEGIENLKRTARDIKFVDSDGDVIKIIKTEPLIGKLKFDFLVDSLLVYFYQTLNRNSVG